MVSVPTATLNPNSFPSTLSEAVSLAFSVSVPVQPATGFTNTYAAPGRSSATESDAPTTTVSPLTARLTPKKSRTTGPETVSLAFSVSMPVQPATGFTNMYAVRWPEFASGATTMLSPLAATTLPKTPCGVASDAVSLALCVSVPLQPPAGFTNTYAAPCKASAPGAPTTMASPLIATDWPNPSPAVPPETMSFALSVSAAFHPPAGLTNTCADPPVLLV